MADAVGAGCFTGGIGGWRKGFGTEGCGWSSVGHVGGGFLGFLGIVAVASPTGGDAADCDFAAGGGGASGVCGWWAFTAGCGGGSVAFGSGAAGVCGACALGTGGGTCCPQGVPHQAELLFQLRVPVGWDPQL